MATTWPTRKVDSALAGDGAYVLGRDLFDRDQCVKQAGSTQYVTPDKTTTTTTAWGATLFTFGIRYPNFMRSGEVVRLTLWVKNGSSVASHFRIADVATSTFGTDATTSASTLTLCTSTLTVPDGWYGTFRTITVQGYVTSASTGTYSTTALCANLRFGD